MENERDKALNSCRLYVLTELEPIIGVSHQTLVRYVKAGTLKANKINGKWRVNQKDLEDFINGK